MTLRRYRCPPHAARMELAVHHGPKGRDGVKVVLATLDVGGSASAAQPAVEWPAVGHPERATDDLHITEKDVECVGAPEPTRAPRRKLSRQLLTSCFRAGTKR